MQEPVHVIGATGRSGLAVLHRLRAAGVPVVPVVRRPAGLEALGVAPRVADLTDAPALKAALADARFIVNTADARHTVAVLAAAPEAARLVLLGSTRRFTRFPDQRAMDVAAGEAAFLASGRPGVMLHPTMIYGAAGERNVQRLAEILHRLPFVPLPGGGTNLVQPIYQDDVTAAVIAALGISWEEPEVLVIAGPEPVTYAAFTRAVAAAAGLKRPRLVRAPGLLLMLAARFGRHVPGLPRVEKAEIRRLLEDKTFDIAPMIQRLGIRPTPLTEGLARTFERTKIMK